MQWGFLGKPNWYAPREIALYLAPALCALILTPLAVFTQFVPSSDLSDEATALSKMLAIGVGHLAVHLAYLRGLERGAAKDAQRVFRRQKYSAFAGHCAAIRRAVMLAGRYGVPRASCAPPRKLNRSAS